MSIVPNKSLSYTRLYKIYNNMKQRCLNKNCFNFYRYGGRGIKICQKWLGKEGFLNFYNWAIENGYSDNLTIDRRNNDWNYCPKNCRWIERKYQARNTSKTKLVRINYETKPLSNFAKEYGISYNTVKRRLDCGMSLKKALTTPTKNSKKISHVFPSF